MTKKKKKPKENDPEMCGPLLTQSPPSTGPKFILGTSSQSQANRVTNRPSRDKPGFKEQGNGHKLTEGT